MLCIVPTQSPSPVVAVGSVSAAATTGALVAMGHRAGIVALPFASIGATLLHRTVSAASANLVLAGLVLHVTIAFLWSVVFVFLVRRARFFFQAEDGIRDKLVTGVQTCAHPICASERSFTLVLAASIFRYSAARFSLLPNHFAPPLPESPVYERFCVLSLERSECAVAALCRDRKSVV